VGRFVGKNSRVATILSLGIEHRTAVERLSRKPSRLLVVELCSLYFLECNAASFLRKYTEAENSPD